MKTLLFLCGGLVFLGAIFMGNIGERMACSLWDCQYPETLAFDSSFRNVHYTASNNDYIPKQTRKILIELHCPGSIRINVSPVVRLDYNEMDEFVDIFAEGLPRRYTQSDMSSDTSVIELGASSFDVYPTSGIAIGKGKKLPLQLKWTVSARKTGEHNLILNISQLMNNMGIVEDSAFKINGMEFHLPSSGEVSIPITVLTEWGITERTQFVIQCILSLVAFVLMWPVFISWIEKKQNG